MSQGITVKLGSIDTDSLSDPGLCLMDALKAFIVPVVKSYLCAGNDQHHNESTTSSANHVLLALKELVAQVVEEELRNGDQEACNSNATELRDVKGPDSKATENPGPLKAEVVVENEVTNVAPLCEDEDYSKVKMVRKEILNHMQKFIFNKFPIRVLFFNKDGSDIRLVDRGEVLSIISSEIILDLNNNARENFIVQAIMERINQDASRNHWVTRYCEQYKRFAILSHTWLQEKDGEVTYANWKNGTFDRSGKGYHKLVNFCRVAAENHQLKFGWMDNVCINKDSSSELDESIRSMFRWYEASYTCITHLAETSTVDEIHRDRWFTRGWTLQELLAPKVMFFYNLKWRRLSTSTNDKKDPAIMQEIENATSISSNELSDFSFAVPISRRMEWAASRQVTREEDIAYSLMGIFGISMSTAYGEGAERAFLRLVKKILGSSIKMPIDILNWNNVDIPASGHALQTSRLLPTSPKHFAIHAYPADIWKDFTPSHPLTLTHLGLRMSAILLSGFEYDYHSTTNRRELGLPTNPIGSIWGITDIHFASGTKPIALLDKEETKRRPLRVLLAIINHTIEEDNVKLGRKCLAVVISVHDKGRTFSIPANDSVINSRLQTREPTTFRLYNHAEQLRTMKIGSLEQHGLYLRTLYM